MSYDFFENKSCEFHPCHKIEEINCLFCFCPLYNLKNCGGNFTILENNVKDCSNCLIPHYRENYRSIVQKLNKGDIKPWIGNGNKK